MITKHQIICDLYKDKGVEVVYGEEDGSFTATKIDGTVVAIDQSAVDAARATLDAEYAAMKYQDDRRKEYPDWGTQLDYIYHNGVDKWKADIVDPVKAKYPKPE